MIDHCMFEQSGTFKKAFKDLGIQAYDYDIQNEFGQTDYIVDLYDQIEKGYKGEASIFDQIKQDDIIMSFFPCIRFEDQIQLYFRGTAIGQRDWDNIKKLEYSMNLHKELHHNYMLVSKMAVICYRMGLKMVIENPYSTTHYLTKYFPIKAAVIDTNRRLNGDNRVKPTQYWFINCEPKNNLVFDQPIVILPKKTHNETHNTTERSMISPWYARKFIKEYIL